MTVLDDVLLPHIDARAIEEAYRGAPGNELDSGKLASPESSAALVANGFGPFLTRPDLLPRLSGVMATWPPRSVTLEGIARFPWSGGRHPCLDVLIECQDAIVGVESKRYEPFRPKGRASMSEAYWRPVWGGRMGGFERIRDDLKDGVSGFAHLDAAQLVKHAFGLRTQASRTGRRATLLYLHSTPTAWPDGRPVTRDARERHRREIAAFAEAVSEDEVAFVHATWKDVLDSWLTADERAVRDHAEAVLRRYAA